ncbi:glycoside hydrolase family 2 TIM barrel-domain containing protein [Haloferax sp. AS1]|uniref:glycoside hydrolase family 2 TIM barrel-domain containing protein n=1 Tax=Haloferax sp. AS1 TaxID=2562277 RepID=UPI00165F5608|nr:glycoside hydrolase family 2 TIM barrel-domain containing protein [Haloferax sp. AS1]
MTDNSSQQADGAAALTRRSMLSAMSGITLGTMLPVGASAAPTSAQSSEDYEAIKAAATLTPRPTGSADGGTESLNGTWDFALSRSETPPTAGGARRVTPDRSSRGNDATVVGDPPVVTDPSERALDLAGESHVAVGDANSLNFTSPGFAVQLTLKYSEDTLLFSKGGSQYSAGVYGGELSFWTQGEGNWPTARGGDLSPGEWYTASFVVAESELRVYVDGDRVGTTAHGFSSLPSTEIPLYIGYNAGDGTHGTPVVDAFRVFDTALTDAEVATGFETVPASAVAWLPFDTTSGGTTPDQSGAGNDGTLVGDPTAVSGRDGRGLDLAGDGYVSTGSDASLNFADTGFTLEAVVRYDGGSGLVLDKGSSAVSSGTEQFGLGIYDGTVSFYVQTAAGSYPNSLQTDIETGAWHRLTVVVDETQSRLFVDGTQVGAVVHGADGFASSSAPFVVGGDGLDVTVKSTAAFDTALTASQVERGVLASPDSAVLWLTYDTVEDTGVEWRDESVPGQWGYDGYYLPSGASDWYPPDGTRGWYRREFTVPAGWDDGRLLLRFDGVYSHAWVYLNGSLVAEHVGGYTPFEADVTDAVNADRPNELAVAVSQQSKADDMGWQNVTGGITRDVTLVSVPEVQFADFDVMTTLADRGDAATVHVDTAVRNAGEEPLQSGSVEVTLTGPDGSTVGSAQADLAAVEPAGSRAVALAINVADPDCWNPEQPALYTVNAELTAGDRTERLTKRVGIREITVDGTDLRLNGESVLLRGVNWEEIHLATHGHAVPADVTRADARRLKEANVNFVRTAHHPTSEAFLDACDELGIIVEVEAPHMFIGRHRGDPYPEVVVQQTLEMVERDKNRASVCIWSIANESDWYECFDTVARLVKEVDPTRPTIFNHDEYDAADPWHDKYDLRAHHYPALRSGSTVAGHADLDGPTLFDEYGHTYCYNDQELVTDPGLRDEWGRVFETIWEQCRAGDAVAGAALWAGGDHLEQWGGYLWGTVDRNRRHRPEFWHLRKTYAPVRFTDAEWNGNGNAKRVTVTVENRHEFVDLSERIVVADDGRRAEEVSVDLPPGETGQLSFTAPDGRLELRVEHPSGYTVNEFVTARDDPGAACAPDCSAATNGRSAEGFEARDGRLVASAGGLSVDVDTESGAVAVRSADGDPLVGDPELAVTPTQDATGRDYDTAIDHRLSGRTVTDVRRLDESSVVVDVAYDDAHGSFTLHVTENRLVVDYDFTLAESVDAREVGLALPTTSAHTTLSWIREGLWSVYPEDHIGRQVGTASAFPSGSRPDHVGIYIQSGQPWADDTTFHGSNDFRSTKRNVTSAELTDDDGVGIRVAADGSQHVRAQARSETVDLLVLDRSISGTNADNWLDRQPLLDQQPTLDAGEFLTGSVMVQAAGVGAAANGDDGRGRDRDRGRGQRDETRGDEKRDEKER